MRRSRPVESPTISVGVPVYNGARFLEEALQSVLAQDFADFEIVIADNCSTDETPQIARLFADSDPRVRYVRHPRNIGAAKNYNYVFHCSSGKYFHWVAHDDLLAPGFMSACLEGFAAHGDVPVLVYPNFACVDENFRPVRSDERHVHTMAASPVVRFRDALENLGQMTEIYGLFRRDALARTPLMGSFVGSDWALMVECALMGPICRLESEVLFRRRVHGGRSFSANRTVEERLAWFDPDAATALKPSRRRSREYLRSIFAVEGLRYDERLAAAAYLQSRRLGSRSLSELGRLARRLRPTHPLA